MSQKNTILLKKLSKGPKKFEALLPDGKKVRFGAAGSSDYTIHKSAERMARYVFRHGGKKAKETSPKKIHNEMLNATSSSKENWSRSGIRSAGFWSRWILWSHPSLSSAIRQTNSVLKGKFKVRLSKSK